MSEPHKCGRSYNISNATSTWLSKMYLDKLADEGDCKIKSMKKTIRKDWMVNVSYAKISRAKKKAFEIIQGNHGQQYLRLWDYCEMVGRQNPVLEAETKSSWTWFLKNLNAVIGRPDERGCYYSPKSKWVDKNVSESFNEYIKEARDKPIVANAGDDKKRKKLKTRGCDVLYDGRTIFGVSSSLKTYIVEIGAHTCTCRKWDLKGIPCKYAIGAIYFDKREPKDFVHSSYHIGIFIRTHSNIINPIPDQDLWVQTNYDPIMPPPLRRQSGRPKNGGRKQQRTHRVRKMHDSLTCGNCKPPGHNTRTCKAPKTIVKKKQFVVVGDNGQNKGNSQWRYMITCFCIILLNVYIKYWPIMFIVLYVGRGRDVVSRLGRGFEVGMPNPHVTVQWWGGVNAAPGLNQVQDVLGLPELMSCLQQDASSKYWPFIPRVTLQ
ncbi:uncharacterized protein LOC130786435 [Actinidia eriantha]|uniref:uncharacterized protein LOC130786435 n=1 Tax=Actinidia eriantha TaxID=165200 RepID=UPI00258B9128|nr:uncharacterized protein LOC130786435 [Actinidia eriantha]